MPWPDGGAVNLLGGHFHLELYRNFAGPGNILRAPGPLRGGVVDWIKPTLSGGSLNVADLAINAAIIAVLVALVLDWLRQRRDPSGNDPAPA
jgi:hypothetical protein